MIYWFGVAVSRFRSNCVLNIIDCDSFFFWVNFDVAFFVAYLIFKTNDNLKNRKNLWMPSVRPSGFWDIGKHLGLWDVTRHIGHRNTERQSIINNKWCLFCIIIWFDANALFYSSFMVDFINRFNVNGVWCGEIWFIRQSNHIISGLKYRYIKEIIDEKWLFNGVVVVVVAIALAIPLNNLQTGLRYFGQ